MQRHTTETLKILFRDFSFYPGNYAAPRARALCPQCDGICKSSDDGVDLGQCLVRCALWRRGLSMPVIDNNTPLPLAFSCLFLSIS